MRQRLIVPFLLAALTGACGAAVWFAPSASPERVAGALLLCLVLPGAALARLLSWEGRDHSLGRLLLTPALSLAVVILDSVILYLVGVHLDTHSWTISLGGVTLLAAVLGPFRAIPLPRLRDRQPRARPVLALGAGALAILLAATVLVTMKGVRAQARADHFTQLWVLPGAGDVRTATVGVFNHEGGRTSYQVELTVNGRLQSLWTVPLRQDGRWTAPVQLPPQAGSVRVILVKSSAPEVAYREVHLRLTPIAPTPTAPASTPAASTPSVSNSAP